MSERAYTRLDGRAVMEGYGRAEDDRGRANVVGMAAGEIDRLREANACLEAEIKARIRAEEGAVSPMAGIDALEALIGAGFKVTLSR